MAGNFRQKLYSFLEKASGYRIISKLYLTKRKTQRLLLLTFGLLTVMFTLIALDQFIPNFISIPVIIVGVSTLIFILAWILIIDDRHMARNSFILIGLMVLSIIWKGMHMYFGSVLISLVYTIMAFGFYFYSIKLIFSIKNNNYLKIVGSFASLIISLTSMGTLFKYNHWPGASIMLFVGLPPLLILTLIVLITIPNSGYIKWRQEHRKLFSNKLLIIWLFVLAFAGFKLLLPPETQKQLFESESSVKPAFGMDDYPIPHAEGLESTQ